jgi:hypothetical protein
MSISHVISCNNFGLLTVPGVGREGGSMFL